MTVMNRRQARLLRGALIIAGCLAVVTPTLAADSKVSGTVHNGEGAPIEGAKVVFEDPARGQKFNLKTNGKGEFFRRGVAPSTYTMTVEKEGFTAHIVEEIRVQAGVDRSFEIVLKTQEERREEVIQQRIAEGDSYLKGFGAFEQGDYEAALASADETIAKNPDDPRGYDMKAKALVRLRRYAEAIPLLERELALPHPAEDAHSVLAGAVYNAGAVASQEERMEEALAYWLRAEAMAYPEPKLAKLIGQAYLAKADFPNATIYLRRYLEKNAGADDVGEVQVLLKELEKLDSK